MSALFLILDSPQAYVRSHDALETPQHSCATLFYASLDLGKYQLTVLSADDV